MNNEKISTNSPQTLLQSKSSASTTLLTNSSRVSLQSKSSTLNILTMPLQLPISEKAITSSQTAQSTASTQLTNLNNSLQFISLTKKRKADATTSDLSTTTTSNKFSKQSSI
ncbi:17217_t:CDS:1, partial [Cetraspora pellucida]